MKDERVDQNTRRGRPPGISNPRGGRKPIYRDPMLRVTLSLPQSMIDRAKELGKGNVSRGIRIMIAH